jgi:hypothetical protein
MTIEEHVTAKTTVKERIWYSVHIRTAAEGLKMVCDGTKRVRFSFLFITNMPVVDLGKDALKNFLQRFFPFMELRNNFWSSVVT